MEGLRARQRKPASEVTFVLPPTEVTETMKSMCQEQVSRILSDPTHMKASRDNAMFALLDEVKPIVVEKFPDVASHLISEAFWGLGSDIMQTNILDHRTRCDGRGMYDLRPIQCEVDVFNPLHGSSVFKRGETQFLHGLVYPSLAPSGGQRESSFLFAHLKELGKVFCTVTFDSPESAAKADLISMILGSQRSKRFMLHYEFPPFATNEIGRFLGTGRREVGHGALAEKALEPLLPPEDFTFTVRLNSQVLDSNGSSSMASVCGGSLALFDAGVPMSRAAAGVACGLAVRSKPGTDEIEKYQILTDISGIEDALGHMDFKMAGTRQGITSLQMDIKKLLGIPYHIFEEAVMQSRDARYQILDIMDECQSFPRPQIKENGPAYTTIEVPTDKRLKLIGAGGHRIRALVADTGAVLQTISETSMSIFAPNRDTMDDVMERIESIFEEEPEIGTFEVGAVYPATITDVREFGLMVELAPGTGALLHKSQISDRNVDHPRELGFDVGQRINVKYLGKDPMTGRHFISRKALLTFSTSSSSS